jgi:uncharacterized membrane protein YgcG
MGKGVLRMKNLIMGILFASTAILGFYAYQTSQKVTGLQADLTAKTDAVTALEGEKTALTEQVAALQAQVDAAAAVVVAPEAGTEVAPDATAPATNP